MSENEKLEATNAGTTAADAGATAGAVADAAGSTAGEGAGTAAEGEQAGAAKRRRRRRRKPASQKADATATEGAAGATDAADANATATAATDAAVADNAATAETAGAAGEGDAAGDAATSTKPRKPRRRKKKEPKTEEQLAAQRAQLAVPVEPFEADFAPVEPVDPATLGEFASFELSDPVRAAVAELGYTTPTPVQVQAIPAGIAGRDIMASAQTGTGKTAAFLLPIFENLTRTWENKRPGGAQGPFVLVLSPTRELATQIADCAETIAKHAGFRVLSIIGGVKYEKQIKGLACGCDVLIATPGRLNDLHKQNLLSLESVKYLVLDEVDRMVDMGFWPSVYNICRKVPKPRQTFLFSATFTSTLEAKANLLVSEPERIEISHKGQTADAVEEFFCAVSFSQKQRLMLALLEEQGPKRVLVFTPTKQEADTCAAILQRQGISADSIHADKPQGKRDRALKEFREGAIDVLVATDVIARGIDINDVRYVINFTVPLQVEDYTHRIGRTGRAGESGRAYTFVSPDQVLPLREIEYFTGHLLKSHDVAGFEYDRDRFIPDPNRPAKRGVARGGRRPGMRRR